MNRVLAMILAGGAGDRLSLLAIERAKPAVTFGGKYKIIDFSLSNCVNSGIYQVAILTQYKPRSLMEHIGTGRAWDIDRGYPRGISILQPYVSRTGGEWYEGTADAIYHNIYFIEERKTDEILILAGDHVYTMRYDYMIASHRNKAADVTVAVYEVPLNEASRFGIITIDHTDRIVGFTEKPASPESGLVSMGIYIFNKEVLLHILEEDQHVENSTHDFGRDILPRIIGTYKVYAHKFTGYWRDVGTVDSYWQANMDLITDLPEFNLYNPETTIHTIPMNQPPAKIGPRSHISRSLICHGCIINGVVRNSLLSSGVYIEDNAVVEDSIIFADTHIGKGAIINRSIIDKEVWIGPGTSIGAGDDYTPNRDEPNHLYSGITIVGKGAKVPPNTTVGRNCKIGCWVEKNDFENNFIPSGNSVERKVPKRYRV